MSDYRFTLAGVQLSESEDLFGIWELPPVTEVSFEASPTVEASWQIELPGESGDAQSLLNSRQTILQKSNDDLLEASRRLSDLERGEGISFQAAAGPEAELLASKDSLQGLVSFAPGMPEAIEQQALMDRWLDFLAQAKRLISNFVHVESTIGGHFVGRTAVGWTGDFKTYWTAGTTPSSMRNHLDAVHLALDSRIALIRLLTVIGTGAARLGLRMTIPGAQLFLLPAIWKFVRDVMKELRRSWPQISSTGFYQSRRVTKKANLC